MSAPDSKLLKEMSFFSDLAYRNDDTAVVQAISQQLGQDWTPLSFNGHVIYRNDPAQAIVLVNGNTMVLDSQVINIAHTPGDPVPQLPSLLPTLLSSTGNLFSIDLRAELDVGLLTLIKDAPKESLGIGGVLSISLRTSTPTTW